MRDVAVNTCIKWAYGVQDSQISGPAWLQSEHFDIVAKADGPSSDEQMKLITEEKRVVRKPVTLSFEEAATLPTVGVTAWLALVVKGQLKPGQRVFVNGALGGVGRAAVLIAKALGASVTGRVGPSAPPPTPRICSRPSRLSCARALRPNRKAKKGWSALSALHAGHASTRLSRRSYAVFPFLGVT